MERRMEVRSQLYRNWSMTATVEARTNAMGEVGFHIVPPVSFKEATFGDAQHPAMENHTGRPFKTADDAFDAAFRDCQRDIDLIIESRRRGPAQ
jgi:hypothetical protein